MDIPFDNSVVELRIHICCTEQQIELLSSLFAIPTFLSGFARTSNLCIFKYRSRTRFWWFFLQIFTERAFEWYQPLLYLDQNRWVKNAMRNIHAYEYPIWQKFTFLSIYWADMLCLYYPGSLVKDKIKCTVNLYQGKHRNQFLLLSETRIAYLL